MIVNSECFDGLIAQAGRALDEWVKLLSTVSETKGSRVRISLGPPYLFLLSGEIRKIFKAAVFLFYYGRKITWEGRKFDA